MENENLRTVHCHACSKLITLGADDKPGDTGTCPFCRSEFRIEEITVLVTRPTTEN